MITQIVATGCSCTYGFGLENPKKDSWPGQLATLLNLDCVNLAINGSGNEYILRSIIDYFIKNKGFKDKSLVVIGLTSYYRVEFLHKNSEEFFCTNLNSWKEKEFTKNFFEERFSSRFYYLRYLRYIFLLQQFLKNWDIPFVIFESLDNGHRDFDNDSEILELRNEIDKSHSYRLFEDSFLNIINNDIFDNGHPNYIGHKTMSELLYHFIMNNPKIKI